MNSQPRDKKPILEKSIAEKVDQLCLFGDSAMKESLFEKAAQFYIEAFRLLPKPKEQWEIASHLIFDWGLAYFEAKQWDTAVNSFSSALFYPTHANSPLIHIYIGMAHHHNKSPEEAKKHLALAYSFGGCEVFHGHDEIFLKIGMAN